MVVKAVSIFAVTTAIAVSILWATSTPPKEWMSANYQDADLYTLRAAFNGVSHEEVLKTGFGWADVNVFIDNHIVVVMGASNVPDDKVKIALVHLDRWIKLPIIGRHRASSMVLFNRPGFKLISDL